MSGASLRRMRAIARKEWWDLRQNLGLFAPAIVIAVVVTLLPVFVAVVVPTLTDEALTDSSDFDEVLQVYRQQPELAGLDDEALIQVAIFQYFVLLLALAPVTCSMTVASTSIVGEKQSRALEPLLATPITTAELLGGKIIAALVPAVAIAIASLVLYVSTIAVVARSGVSTALVSGRMLALVLVIGPLASMAAMQLAVCVSSRASDARTAQQAGALVILPVVGIFVAQLFGAVSLTLMVSGVIAAVLVVANGGLLLLAVRIFDRESILTRWK